MLCNTRSVARIKNSKKSLGPKRNHPEDGIPSVSNSAHCIKARLQRYHADGEDDTGLRPLGLIGARSLAASAGVFAVATAAGLEEMRMKPNWVKAHVAQRSRDDSSLCVAAV